MRVIIGGAGRVGIALAKAMANEKYDLVVVDNDSRAVANAQSLDCLVVNGNITSRETLLEAGITNASVFIAATPSDETNLIACSIAEHAHETKEGVDRLTSICRLRTTSYVNEYRAGHLLEWAKVDHVVNPLHGAILRLNAGLRSTELEEVIPFGDEAYIIEFDIGESAVSIVGRPLREVREDFVHGLPNIVGVKRDGERSFVPNEDSVLKIGDRIAVSVIGLDKFNPALITFGHEISYFPEHPRVIIVGATPIGTKMAEDWLKHGANVTVLERELHLANKLAGSATGGHLNIDVIHGDHLDRSVLEEISIGQFDVAVSALEDDHANIAAVLMMSDLGVPHTGLMLYDADLVKVTSAWGFPLPWTSIEWPSTTSSRTFTEVCRATTPFWQRYRTWSALRSRSPSAQSSPEKPSVRRSSPIGCDPLSSSADSFPGSGKPSSRRRTNFFWKTTGWSCSA